MCQYNMSKHCSIAYTVERCAIAYALFVCISNVYSLCGLLECDIEKAGWRSQTTSVFSENLNNLSAYTYYIKSEIFLASQYCTMHSCRVAGSQT